MTDHVIVVGGGIAGSSAAYRLARRGTGVTLIDRADPGHATAAGAGILSPATSSRSASAWYPLAFRAVAYYPELIAALAGDGVTDTGYAVPGGLVIASGDDAGPLLGDIYRILEERRRGGVANIGELSVLDDAEARKLFPPLAPGTSAIHLSEVARVNGRVLRDALQQAARARGVRIRRESAQLITEGGRAAGVRAGADLITADAVILATGAWNDAWPAGLAAAVPVAPQRGQILHLDLPGTDTSGWPVITGSGDPYLLGFPPNRIVAGATREDGTRIRLPGDRGRPGGTAGLDPGPGARAGQCDRGRDAGRVPAVRPGRPAGSRPRARAGQRMAGDRPGRDRADRRPVRRRHRRRPGLRRCLVAGPHPVRPRALPGPLS